VKEYKKLKENEAEITNFVEEAKEEITKE